MTDRLDLDLAARLSSRCSSGDFAIATTELTAAHPTPCCWCFGDDDPPGTDTTRRVYVQGDDGALRTSRGALADAEMVAWLLTNRDELFRLARIGQEHDRG